MDGGYFMVGLGKGDCAFGCHHETCQLSIKDFRVSAEAHFLFEDFVSTVVSD
jgi:hypothetical protein